MTKITKDYKTKWMICRFLSILMTIGPLAYFFVKAYIDGEVGVTQKMTLGICTVVCAILIIINITVKKSLRSPIYIIIIGIYVCLDNLMLLFIVMAATTIIDEFIFSPLASKFKNQYTINKEIDKRGEI